MEHDKGSVLFVAHGPFFVWRVISADIHQRQGMIGIFDCSVVVLETEPGDTTVVVLEEFSVGFEALVIVQGKVWGLFFDGKHTVEEGWKAFDRQTVGAALGFHLEDSKIDPHLDNISAVGFFDQTNSQRVGIKSPVVEDIIEPFG
jgi:hypothetical protein